MFLFCQSNNETTFSAVSTRLCGFIPGGGDSEYERGGDARRKSIKDTDLGVAQAFFDP